MKKILYLLVILCWFSLQAQTKIYNASEKKVHNLIHTKLKVDFLYETSQMNGEAWVTIAPHFYETNKVVLDAKAFDIHEVKVNENVAQFDYSNSELTIELDKYYKRNEAFTVYVKYTANPEKVIQKGSTAINDAKGLYFIDPKDEDPDKPTQIWTQGETESSSCWFPTIDSPNQKTTQEIYMTVPDKYVTLSNGTLESQTNNNNGTRTDYWKMDEKHAPYLFFMGVGDFSIVKDEWKGKEVSYYVEPEFEDVARKIFGLTPEMITFFSELTGIEYPWDKYAQIVVRDYVSGAMENTTAVVHGEDAQQPLGSLVDSNEWEGTIAHELFHHWFGDLVTTESWANLTLNESFATYSVYLWYMHKYGKDRAEAHMYEDIQVYLNSQSSNKDLVRFDYEDKEQMFDPVSYHKGSAILHMLRNYIGDKAFFEGVNYYLNTYKFGTAEAHELRLAFEKITGEDLNWFFNQWYYSDGHIIISISYDYNVINKTVTVNVDQLGKTFEFPLEIDIYKGNSRERHKVWVKEARNAFTFQYGKRQPDLINVDPQHILLADKSDRKTLNNYLFQLRNAPHYLDRKLALENIAKQQDGNKDAFDGVVSAFSDPFDEIRILALDNIDLFQKYFKKDAIEQIERIAKNDESTRVRAAAIRVLGKLVDPLYKPLFEEGINATSYAIKGSSLQSLYQIDKDAAIIAIRGLNEQDMHYMSEELTMIYINEQDKTKLPVIAKNVLKGMFLTNDQRTQEIYAEAFKWIAQSDNEEAIQTITDDFVKYGVQFKEFKFDKMAINLMNQMISAQQQSTNSNKDELIFILKKGLSKLLE